MSDKLPDLDDAMAAGSEPDDGSPEEGAALLDGSDDMADDSDISPEEAALIEAALGESGGDAAADAGDLSDEDAAFIEAALVDDDAEVTDDPTPVPSELDDEEAAVLDALSESGDDEDDGGELPDVDDALLFDAPEEEAGGETLPPPPDLATPKPSELPDEAAAELREPKPAAEPRRPAGRAASRPAVRVAAKPATKEIAAVKDAVAAEEPGSAEEAFPAPETGEDAVADEPEATAEAMDFMPYAGAPNAEDLQVDAQLIEQIDDIVSRREHTLGLLGNAEDRKDKVKPEIYKKVISDYNKQLRGIEGEYEPVSLQICQAVAEISRRESELRSERENVNDVLVEMRFRCEVGEFTEEDLFPIEAENNRKLKALDARLEVVEQTYIICQKYLREADFDAAIKQQEPPPPPPQEEVEEEEVIEVAVPSEEVEIDVFDGADAQSYAEPQGDAPVGTDPNAYATTPPGQTMEPGVEYQAWRAQGASEDPTLAVAAGGPSEEQSVQSYIILKTEGGSEEAYALGADPFAIGRHPKNDMVLTDRGISRRHARIVVEGSGRYTISDLSSGNGIFVNGERVSGKSELNNGDHIVMGNCQLCYVERLE